MEETKPFKISKQAVKIAFDRVKANKGTYGIDEQTIAEFEENLKDNLYKIWNRMSSGTYFPKPVKAVAIPKKNGGTRILGIPTVEDRILSKKGCPYDNAVAEATYKIIKTEFAFNRIFESFEELETELFDYVNWYNNIRIHSSLNYLTPIEYKKVSL